MFRVAATGAMLDGFTFRLEREERSLASMLGWLVAGESSHMVVSELLVARLLTGSFGRIETSARLELSSSRRVGVALRLETGGEDDGVVLVGSVEDKHVSVTFDRLLERRGGGGSRLSQRSRWSGVNNISKESEMVPVESLRDSSGDDSPSTE